MTSNQAEPQKSPFRAKPPLLDLLRQIVRTWRRISLTLRTGSRLVLAKHVVIGANADIRPPQRGEIKEYVAIGKNFTAEVDFIIGSDVLISSNVSFIGNHHNFDDPATTVYRQGRKDNERIVVHGDSLIGFGAIIVGNVTIHRGAIIGAGSIVTRDVPADWVYAGAPARPIRHRYSKRSSSAIDSKSTNCFN